MTTKTGEKLRGRKRDPSVMAKAWETRRANAKKKKRAVKASTGRKATPSRSEIMKAAWARRKAGEIAVQMESPMMDFAAETSPVHPLDHQLVSEFVARCLLIKEMDTGSFGLNAVPWSQLDAVLRRLNVAF